MDEEDAAADPYLPYDGGGDTIPLQEIPKRGMPYPVIHFFHPVFRVQWVSCITTVAAAVPTWKSCSANVD